MDSAERCEFRAASDPSTDEPLGPACGRTAIQTIFWRGGRHSSSCERHGADALDDVAIQQVHHIERIATPGARS